MQDAVDGGTTATVVALLDGATLWHAQARPMPPTSGLAHPACLHPLHSSTCLCRPLRLPIATVGRGLYAHARA